MDDLPKIAEAYRGCARVPSTKPYIWSPYPSTLDDLAQKLIDLYLVASDRERVLVGQILTDTQASNALQAFVLRAATQGVRQNSSEMIFKGLMALVIEDERRDYRESIMLSTVIINAAVRVDADPVELFDRASVYATPSMAEALVEYLDDYRRTKNNGLMGHRCDMTDEGVVYY
jgi:hypothetical protein